MLGQFFKRTSGMDRPFKHRKTTSLLRAFEHNRMAAEVFRELCFRLSKKELEAHELKSFYALLNKSGGKW